LVRGEVVRDEVVRGEMVRSEVVLVVNGDCTAAER